MYFAYGMLCANGTVEFHRIYQRMKMTCLGNMVAISFWGDIAIANMMNK